VLGDVASSEVEVEDLSILVHLQQQPRIQRQQEQLQQLQQQLQQQQEQQCEG
jgi:hypothetical protein